MVRGKTFSTSRVAAWLMPRKLSVLDTALFMTWVLLLLLVTTALGGCQNTEGRSSVNQATPVVQQPQIDTGRQDTAGQSESRQVIYAFNGPLSPGASKALTESPDVPTALLEGLITDGARATNARASYMQVLVFDDQAMNPGGSSSGFTGGQVTSPSSVANTPTGTSSTTQEPRFEPRTTVPISAGASLPGSNLQQQTSGATEGSTVTPNQTATMDAMAAQLKAQQDTLVRLAEELVRMRARLPLPTTAPASQPTE